MHVAKKQSLLQHSIATLAQHLGMFHKLWPSQRAHATYTVQCYLTNV